MDLIQLLRDPVWQFIGALVAFAAILVSVALYFAQRSRKDLTFEIVSNSEILTIAEENVGKLQLLFDGQPVKHARLIEVRVVSTGNQPISPDDFVDSLRFLLNEEAKVLSAVVVDRVPSNLAAQITFGSNVVNVAPLLLNPKDSFTVKVLVSGYNTPPKAEARITGVTHISQVRERLTIELLLMSMSVFFIITAFLLMSHEELDLTVRSDQVPSIAASLISFICTVLATVRLARRVKSRRQISAREV
jgi:hypothetical protein